MLSLFLSVATVVASGSTLPVPSLKAALAPPAPHAEGEEGAGHHGHNAPREYEPGTTPVPMDPDLFGPDPVPTDEGYDPAAQIEIYGGKSAVKTFRPLLELGGPLYSRGELGEGIPLVGQKNLVKPQMLVYGDSRTAVAYNDNQGKDVAQVATRLNLEVDLKLTATERIHAFFQPLQEDGQFTRLEFGGGDANENDRGQVEASLDPTTLFFEGDFGAILAGLTDNYQSFDLPFTFGRIPMLLQNGIWMEDAFLGYAMALPAKNSPKLDISNYDLTFFFGLDEVTSDAFKNADGTRADHDAKVAGAVGFFELREGYLEVGYAYLHDSDDTNGDHSYHNATVAFTKRYLGRVSNSTRVIANFGQDPGNGFEQTADGVIFLFENSLITSKPLTFVPYANFWASFGTPQSVARAAASGGILRNTGINFETDGLTGFPTLDATGKDSVGGAIGLQNLYSLNQQLVTELAFSIPHGSNTNGIEDAEVALGVRYQRPLNHFVIFRADAMYGYLGKQEDTVSGARAELRIKF